MKIAMAFFVLAALCLFGGIVSSLWVSSSISWTVVGSGFWSCIGLAVIGGLCLTYESEVAK